MGYVKVCFLAVLLLAVSNEGFAGSLNDTGAPDSAASAMYTLEDIYNRLDTGAAGAKRTGAFTEPSAGPASSGHTLDEVMGKAPTADNTNGAVAAQVLEGYTFWGLTSGAWGLSTGTMTDVGPQHITPGTTAQTITEGYHNGAGSVAGDADLAAGNIKKDVEIFGVTGTYEGGGAYPALVPETGQTPTVPFNPAPAGSDGALQKGVPWPNPRFTDNSDGQPDRADLAEKRQL